MSEPPFEATSSLEIVPYDPRWLQHAAPSIPNLRHEYPCEGSAGPSTPTSVSTSSWSATPESGPEALCPRHEDQSRDYHGPPRAPRRKKGPRGPWYSKANSLPLGGATSHYQPYPSPLPRHDVSLRFSAPSQNETMHLDSALIRAESSAPTSQDAPFHVGSAIPVQQSREIFRDTDTGTLHPMRITEASFSAMGLSADLAQPPPPASSGPHPQGFSPPTPYHPSAPYASVGPSPTYPLGASWPPPAPLGTSRAHFPVPSGSGWNPPPSYSGPGWAPPPEAMGWGSTDPDEGPLPSSSSWPPSAGTSSSSAPPSSRAGSCMNRRPGPTRDPSRR
jgi:hypothetical protein